MAKLLFSPVGTTDPISNLYDGALLHICRHYKPDIIYLYFSKEMLEFNNKDDRYRYCLKKLGEKINWNFSLKMIERPNLINVQDFDYIFDDFYNCIKKIRSENPDDEILLNVASGTPAMKSALNTITVLGQYNLLSIQVSTPLRKHNTRGESCEEYDAKANWENNCDNLDNAENRCKELKNHNILLKFLKNIIIKHLDSYDYVAAYRTALEMDLSLRRKELESLRAATLRIQLNVDESDKIFKSFNYNEVIPIKSGENKKIFEALLWLQMKFKRKDYSDFIRGITPVIYALMEKCVESLDGINIKDYWSSNKTRWVKEKLTENKELFECLNNYFIKNFKSNFRFDENGTAQIYSNNLIPVIEKYSDCDELIDICRKLNKVEQNIRNPIAHNILPVTEKWITEKCGFPIEDIFNFLKKLTKWTDMNISQNDWDSYNYMNSVIKKFMDN